MRKLKHSQNFLKKASLVSNLLEQSTINDSDLVIEIGPGKGIITQELAKRSGRVVAIEKDKNMAEQLKEKFSEQKNVVVKEEDFLEYSLPQEKYKVFSNIPFNFTAQIIDKLFSSPNPPHDSYLIMQKKAARKFCGKPQERLRSLWLKPWFVFQILHQFKQSDFYPQPSVDIVLLRVKRRQSSKVLSDKAQLYRDFISYAFNQPGRNVKQSLNKVFTKTQFKRLAEDNNFSYEAIPTQLNFHQWLALFRYFLQGAVIERKKERVYGAEKRLKKEQQKLNKKHRTGLR